MCANPASPSTSQPVSPSLSPSPSASRNEGRPSGKWALAIVLLAAVLSLLGGMIALVHPALLVSPHDEINSAVQVYAGYLASRNTVIAVVLIFLLYLRAWRPLGNLMAIVGLFQLVDFLVDCAERRWPVAPGVLLLGMVFLAAATRLSGGHPFWRRQAWLP